MLKFKPLIINRSEDFFENLQYLPQVMFLYKKYGKFLMDDFALSGNSFYEYFINLVESVSPYFFVILCDEEVAGFVYLENFTGDVNVMHSAEITTCFDRKYWGGFTYYTALVFFNYCFETLGIKKLKALIYPENFRVKQLLTRCRFEKEGYLKSETVRDGQFQDIEVYALFGN